MDSPTRKKVAQLTTQTGIESARIVIIEGNISAGKSTLTRQLGKLTGFKEFLEPTLNNTYLEKFYEDPKKWALTMQVWLLRQRYKIYVHALKYVLETGNGVILDRSIFSDSVFAEQNTIDENIDSVGYEYYKALRAQLLDNLPIPHVTLYLDTSAEVCYNRIHDVRARDFEEGIPLAYLAGLNKCYLNFVEQMKETGSSVVAIDWNDFGDVETIAEQVKEMCSQNDNSEWIKDLPALLDNLYDDDKIIDRMQPPADIETHPDDDLNGIDLVLEGVVDEFLDDEHQQLMEMAKLDLEQGKTFNTSNPSSPTTPANTSFMSMETDASNDEEQEQTETSFSDFMNNQEIVA
eukprot:TRINITY_DN4138_c0_g1_i1.p1 TRINITY_DN4138_c0_g1~~TRINITY_DN4138_c0_g1_i1.p1  ORF type:complete len:348 (+),score=120.65 TRINITY_DN4138_c0_g1_i1:419-1462(+)